MIAIPIWLSIDNAKLCLKMSGMHTMNSAIAPQTSTRRPLITATADVFVITPSFMRAPLAASRLPRAQEAGRTHDQHQHHHQIGQDRRGLRDSDGRELFQQTGGALEIDAEVTQPIQ